MEVEQLTQLTTLLKSHNQPVSSVFTISANLLSSVLSSLENVEDESPSTSFHVHQTSNVKSEMIRDLHFLNNFIQTVQSVKIYSDSNPNPSLDLSDFKSLKSIELSKIDANDLRGLQKLRSQIQKIVCNRTTNTLDEVLSDCGGDKSATNCWSNLKEASFINNEIIELDSISLECTPCLHTLDLSHNQLTDIEALNCLSNLKHLNLSYNRLECVPQFKGQICSRLQNLTLSSNFIDDIGGLQSLVNVWALDLSNNCLVDHKCLISVSHMATLQWLNLDSNPLSFHPNHRMRSASYLHVNTESTRFVLDNVALSKSEKKVIGTLHPMQSKAFSGLPSPESVNSVDKSKRIRHVTIVEESSAKPTISPIVTPTSQQHLETKKQIEDLREQYGDSWLKLSLGKSIHDVLGLERAQLPLSSSPYEADFLLHSGNYRQEPHSFKSDSKVEKIIEDEVANKTDASFVTAFETTADLQKDEDEDSAISEDDMEFQGEESMFLATPRGESEEIFLVITRRHITETESSTSKERARWHLDSITSCKMVEDEENTVQLDFETMRRDRKQRVYILLPEEIEKFVSTINEKIEGRLPKKTHTEYQCMKCSAHFARVRKVSVLDEPVIKCPTCDSTLVVESL